MRYTRSRDKNGFHAQITGIITWILKLALQVPDLDLNLMSKMNSDFEITILFATEVFVCPVKSPSTEFLILRRLWLGWNDLKVRSAAMVEKQCGRLCLVGFLRRFVVVWISLIESIISRGGGKRSLTGHWLQFKFAKLVPCKADTLIPLWQDVPILTSKPDN